MPAGAWLVLFACYFHVGHPFSRISVVAMTGAAIAVDDAAAADTILSVKQRVFAFSPKLPVYRQRLMYRPGPHGIEPLADNETLGGAGVAQDGSAELDLLLGPADLTSAEKNDLQKEVSTLLLISRKRAFLGEQQSRTIFVVSSA